MRENLPPLSLGTGEASWSHLRSLFPENSTGKTQSRRDG
jgi:hypothetical protein